MRTTLVLPPSILVQLTAALDNPLETAGVLLVSVVSTLYPAFLAARVSPLQAMQSDD